MKIVYSTKFEDRYAANPVENPDRARLPAELLREEGYDLVVPFPASVDDIRKVHGREHIELVRAKGLYDAAALAAGGAIFAAELSMIGEPAFALIRPPGHHASANQGMGNVLF